ncbi:MAG: hypothetical protein PHF20_10570 [Halothiobacillaceae bacterium]|nr:hypothetical protein [Halothiobacillaceae bacterium]
MALTKQEIEAFNQVKSSIDALRTEYAAVCVDIEATEKQLAKLPLLPVPVSDLKAAILDFVEASGKAYLDEFVKPSITAFSTHMMSGTGTAPETVGKPLGFHELERAIAGTGGALSVAQLITQLNKNQFNDLALYAFFPEQVKAGLIAAMDTMSDADFGYGRINEGQIGTDRATRRLAIQATQKHLDELRARKTEISSTMRQLGVSVN